MNDLIQAKTEERVGIITLNRPKALNALSGELLDELCSALDVFEGDTAIRVIVLTGSEKAFAAGADIRNMAEASAVDMNEHNDLARGLRRMARQFKATTKPVIAAVSGYALGGGCELAMLCDIIIASESAQFGQPEINLGVIPGAGGTQRLTRAIGKYKAMDLVLSGRSLSAQEAFDAGLVAHVFTKDQYLAEALKLAHRIAGKSPIALKAAKEAVSKVDEMSLAEGTEFERRLFYLLFATDDQKEGMKAFIEKREPQFKGQ
jgi:enoyl-CoA hydratase/carnithine racemase